jgi:addiction module HigA family antidote
MHPGEFLMDQVLVPRGLCARKAAEQLGTSPHFLGEVIAGTMPITPALADALAREFCHSRQWWLEFQLAWERERRFAA